jgi:hypothetical protein
MLGSTDNFETRVIANTTGGAAYQEASVGFSGMLVYPRGPTLYGQRFNESRAVSEGDPIPLVSNLTEVNPSPRVAVSGDALAYWTGTSLPKRKLAWLDRSGKPVPG